MSNTPAHTTKQQTKKKFIVSREFSGNQSMKEAFEQLIERQTHSQFEEWLEKKPDKPNLTVERLAGTWYYNGVVSLLIE